MSDVELVWVDAVIGVLGLVDSGLLIYVSYFKLTEIESYLKNCQIVMSNKECWNGIGPVDRVNRLTQISMILDSTQLWHGTDNVDMDEVRNFPITLKRWVLYPYYLGYVLLLVCSLDLIWEKWF